MNRRVKSLLIWAVVLLLAALFGDGGARADFIPLLYGAVTVILLDAVLEGS